MARGGVTGVAVAGAAVCALPVTGEDAAAGIAVGTACANVAGLLAKAVAVVLAVAGSPGATLAAANGVACMGTGAAGTDKPRASTGNPMAGKACAMGLPSCPAILGNTFCIPCGAGPPNTGLPNVVLPTACGDNGPPVPGASGP